MKTTPPIAKKLLQVWNNKNMLGKSLPLHRSRCGECEGCISSNCKSCKYCCDNPKFGGPGKLKKACVMCKCIRMHTPEISTASKTSLKKQAAVSGIQVAL